MWGRPLLFKKNPLHYRNPFSGPVFGFVSEGQSMPLLRLTQTNTGADSYRVEVALERGGASRQTATSEFKFALTARYVCGHEQPDALAWARRQAWVSFV
jgi:hypothetical protein